MPERRRAGQHDAGKKLRERRHHLDRDMATERPAENHGALDAKLAEHGRDGRGDRGQGVAGLRIGRAARATVSGQVDGDHPVQVAERAFELVAENLLAGAKTVQHEQGQTDTAGLEDRDGALRGGQQS